MKSDSVIVPFSEVTSSQYKPKIPIGEYRIAFKYFETTYRFGNKNSPNAAKVVLHFNISEIGSPYFGVPMERWYTVAKLIGKPARGGSFKVKGQTCIFLIEYLKCLQIGRPNRLDRIPMTEWARHEYRANISNVTKNSRQVPLPQELQYSRIESLLGIAE